MPCGLSEVLTAVTAATALGKGVASLAVDKPDAEVPGVKLNRDQTGVAQQLNASFSNPQSPGYRPVGSGIGNLGQNPVGSSYAQRLARIQQQLQQRGVIPLPGSTANLPTG